MSPCNHVDVQWRDRKHYCGLPLSFETYAVSNDRLFLSSGFLRQASREILLYRVRDISLSRSLSQRLFGVGTVRVTTIDNEVIILESVCAPFQVKELIYQNVLEQKEARRFRFGGYPVNNAEAFWYFGNWI